jgi:hypothetical protein
MSIESPDIYGLGSLIAAIGSLILACFMLWQGNAPWLESMRMPYWLIAYTALGGSLLGIGVITTITFFWDFPGPDVSFAMFGSAIFLMMIRGTYSVKRPDTSRDYPR